MKISLSNARLAKGKRLTCPMCNDSSFFTFEQIEAAGGKIDCGNHTAWVTMVDMAELLAIYGLPSAKEGEVLEEEEVTFDMLVAEGVMHPDDFEDWSGEDREENYERSVQ